MCPLTNEHCDSLLIHFYNCQVSCVWRDCHACGSKTLITLLITPVFQFPMPGINVWGITASTLKSMWMIDFLRILLLHKGKVTGDEVKFLCVSMFVLHKPLQSIFGLSLEILATSSEIFRYYWTPTKNPRTLMIKMSPL